MERPQRTRQKRYGFRISTTKRNNPHDNAVCDSFTKIPEHEEAYLSATSPWRMLKEEFPILLSTGTMKSNRTPH